MLPSPVICVDGPSGAGKGTLSRQLAQELNWHLLDSGALYRAVGVACQRAGIELDVASEVAAIASVLEVDFRATDEGIAIWLAEEDVTNDIRSEIGGLGASQVALHPEVREVLLAKQRAWARAPGLVADGRDIGTVVFPDAPLKIFLTASAEARAERRFHQLQGMGQDVSLPRLLADIQERDARDTSREVSPLMPADDAILIDSTLLTADEVVMKVRRLASSRGIVSDIRD
ncbi:MAG: cytidylate kinase [Halieaceae bacterium]|nr:cytidylate kinase [Halieaceae bacterium]|tara:strand:- start:1981 stop:2673 length:693 start_codon:yes stop_codon:yes gene_type:complete